SPGKLGGGAVAAGCRAQALPDSTGPGKLLSTSWLARAQPARAGRLLPQARPQRGQVAGPGARVQLAADDLFPGRAAGGGGAGHAEQERGIGDAGKGARLQRGSPDLLERDRPEQFAEACHFLVQQRPQRLRPGSRWPSACRASTSQSPEVSLSGVRLSDTVSTQIESGMGESRVLMAPA